MSVNKNDNKSNQKKKGYRSIHTNYGPFLRYIENHVGIDDDTVQRTKSKLGTLKSNTNTNSNTMNTVSISASELSKAREDARHADLHANSKISDHTDSDKIFLLKREIDTLNEKLNQENGNGNGITTTTNNHNHNRAATGAGENLVMLTAFLLFGVVLVASRHLARKLRFLRVSASLLLDSDNSSGNNNGTERGYGYNSNSNYDCNYDEGMGGGFELQEQQSSQQQQQQQQQRGGSSGGLFSKLASTLERNTPSSNANPTTVPGINDVSYKAPPEQASVHFV